jgi:hemerythrin-like domain-containing protein
MVNAIEALKNEHELIDIELMELESVMDEAVINYSSLVHCFKKLCDLWDKHEKKEEKIFLIMKKEKVLVPVQMMTSQHRELRSHIDNIKNAINSGSDSRVREVFEKDLKILIGKIREHKDREDEVLFTIALEEFTPEELEEMLEIFNSI